jgi:hypothetical protein
MTMESPVVRQKIEQSLVDRYLQKSSRETSENESHIIRCLPHIRQNLLPISWQPVVGCFFYS